MTATVQPVVRPRGELDDETREALNYAMNEAAFADAYLRKTCVEAVEDSSFRAVSEATGISTNTLQRWKRETHANS